MRSPGSVRRANGRPPNAAEPRAACAMSGFRLPAGGHDRSRPDARTSGSTGGAMRAIPATRWPRRCSPTACASSAGRSNITGRAAWCTAGPEEPSGAGRAARRRPARAQHAGDDGRAVRRARGGEPEPLALARVSTSAAINGLARALLPAGFYYKTFMWPPSFWERLYEPLIRRAAGLGRGSVEAGSRPLRDRARPLRRAGGRRGRRRAARRRARRRRPARA